MVVIRYTWHVPGPNFQEARKLFTEIGPPESSALRAGRGYQSRTGLTHTLALEWEFESLAKWEEFLPQFSALPATESVLTLVGGKIVHDAQALN